MITEHLISGLTRLITGANLRWAGCRPDAVQRVYFANHTSHLDGLVIWTALPCAVRKKTRPVAAKDYWMTNGVRRYLANDVLRVVLIDRKNVTVSNNPMTLLLQSIDDGDSLIIFPEGTRGDSCEAGPFKSGLYHIAKQRPGVDLVPVFIDNMNRILPKGEILAVPLLSCITFGEPIRLHDHESKPDFLERARRAVNQLRTP